MILYTLYEIHCCESSAAPRGGCSSTCALLTLHRVPGRKYRAYRYAFARICSKPRLSPPADKRQPLCHSRTRLFVTLPLSAPQIEAITHRVDDRAFLQSRDTMPLPRKLRPNGNAQPARGKGPGVGGALASTCDAQRPAKNSKWPKESEQTGHGSGDPQAVGLPG